MSEYQITLTTRDGRRINFACAPGEDLVSAAARASILMPGSCKSGGCGGCRASHEAGAYLHDSHSLDALSAEARARGEVLLCRTRPQSDLKLQAPFAEAQIVIGKMPERGAAIVALEDLGGDTLRLVLQLDEDEELGAAAEFEPGQYVELSTLAEAGDHAGITRAYSLANTSNWEGRLEFLIHLQPGGAFSAYLAQAAVGQRLQVRGPQGAFVLREDSLRPRVFVAGGTGLAPMLAMLRRMAEYGDATPATLFFGVGGHEQLFGLDDIAAVQAALPQLQSGVVLWRPAPEWSGAVGTPVDLLAQYLQTNSAKPDIYLCGPAAMIAAAESVAAAAGVPAEQVFSERFLPG